MRVGRVQTHLNFSTPMNATLRRAAITVIAGFSLALTALSVQAQNAAIVNGKAIPSVRVDEFVASLTQQGRPDTPDLRNAVRDELIAREIFVQEAERKGLTRNPETQRQLESARQDILIRALIRDSLKTNPVTDADRAARNIAPATSWSKPSRKPRRSSTSSRKVQSSKTSPGSQRTPVRHREAAISTGMRPQPL
jgi:hypothetical protein